jgi:hypothetical protein
MSTAITARSFINTLGINTHIDFAAYGYQNLATVESAIEYLGVINIRDSAQNASDATAWQQVSLATGAKFDDFIAQTSPAGMTTDLSFVQQLAQEGILNYLEGGDEEDDAYPASLGNTLPITAQFQQQVYATGHSFGLPVINMSFGSGWTAANNWQGDYGAVGDLSAYADYANAHTYPVSGQLPGDTINRLNGLANLAAASRPVMTTEIGWNETQGFTQTQIADYVLDAALDGIKYGDVKTYFYALFDDGSGNFGLMNQDGTPKPAGTALHDLTTLLADTGANAASFTPGSLSYSLSTSDNTLLMEKSDGTFWLAVWNETAPAHSVTVTLGSNATEFTLFDPLAGTSAVQTASNSGSFTFTLSDHPVLVEIAGATSGGSDPGSGGAGGSPTPDPVVTAPASETVAANASVAIAGVSISDPWAATAPGSLALNVSTTGGTIAMKDTSGSLVAGSGSSAISISGTLSQLNADLATLTYTAGTTNAAVTVDVWDQAGIEATKLFGVTVTSPAGGNTITIPANQKNVTENVSNETIVATAGNHMIFIGGTGDVVTATGGTETIQASQGGNTITTGSGNDKVSFAGSNNVINAGSGNNVLQDTGSNNTIVIPDGGQGYDDIFGPVLTNADQLDLRQMLQGTNWNSNPASIGNFVKLTASGSNELVKVDPSGVTGGSLYTVGKLESSGSVSLATLLAHSIT